MREFKILTTHSIVANEAILNHADLLGYKLIIPEHKMHTKIRDPLLPDSVLMFGRDGLLRCSPSRESGVHGDYDEWDLYRFFCQQTYHGEDLVEVKLSTGDHIEGELKGKLTTEQLEDLTKLLSARVPVEDDDEEV